ncbi:MAG: choice-of-anchor K domain-containing protein [Chloroflexi bacterium]|nr:choice-of-anchor K domain-containing protein [Chloroflexota bacterium]
MRKVLVRGFLTAIFFGVLTIGGDSAAAAPALQEISVAGSGSGIFTNPQPASAVVSGVGTDLFTSGSGISPSPPSSLRFTGSSFTAKLDELFSFGTLTFFNGIIAGGTGAESVDLKVTIMLTMPSGVTKEIVQTLTLVNTPNVGTPEENADLIILPSLVPKIEFTVDGVPFTIEFEGFGTITGAGGATTIDRFFVLEEQTASAELLGRISVCGETGFQLGLVPEAPPDGGRTICYKTNQSKGGPFLPLGGKVYFGIKLRNPHTTDIAVTVCAMVNTSSGTEEHPRWIAVVINDKWEAAQIGMVDRNPSFHFGCRQFSSIPAGGERVWKDTGTLPVENRLRDPYIDFLRGDLELANVLDFECRPPGATPPRCVNDENQWLLPDPTVGTVLYANNWVDLERLESGSPTLVGRLQWQVGNWVTMRDPDTYLARLNGTVIDAPTGSVLTFGFPPGSPELERTFVVPPANPDNPTCLGLPVEVSEPFVIPPDQATLSLDVEVPEECSALREGSTIQFLGEAVGEPGSPIFSPGQFIVGHVGTLVVDNVPAQVEQLSAVPVEGGFLDVRVSASDETLEPLAALLLFRVDGGPEEQVPMDYDEPPVEGDFVLFRQTIGPFPPGSTIELTADAFDDVGNSGAPSPTLMVVVPLDIDIDIKPGSNPNSINCNNDKQVITVAILTTDDFDATTMDHTTVSFEGAKETQVDKKSGEPRRHEKDVDGDGDIDLVFHFRLGETALACGFSEGTLSGETFAGLVIAGTDAVQMIDQGGGKP